MHNFLRQKWSIFLFMTSSYVLVGQIQDDFGLNNGDISSIWVGDRDKFIINDNNELQLNDDAAGTARLIGATNFVLNQSWEFIARMDFSPSNSNRLEFFLWADSEDLENATGILLRMGENGSDDAITLIEQVAGNRQEIARGTLGSIASGPVNVRIKITTLDNFFTVSADFEGDVCFLPEIEIPWDGLPIPESFFSGWLCQYSSTRSKLFFIDDVYIGAARIDETPPEIVASSSGPNEIVITYSEPVILSTSDVSIIPDIPVEVHIDKRTLRINSASGFPETVTVNMDNVRDLSENSVDESLTFNIARGPEPGELLINEILFNPVGFGSDYVELVNTTDGFLSCKGLIITNKDNGDEVDLSDIPDIQPGSFFLLTEDITNILEAYPENDPSVMYEVDLPRFNNDEGNVTLSRSGMIIDEYDYDENDHLRFIDDVDGISLERISLVSSTNDSENWTSASASVSFGTPGVKNSATGLNSNETNFSLSRKTFSPDHSNLPAEVLIEYGLASPKSLVTIRIFNESGHLVRTLLDNDIISSSGAIPWNGKNDDDVNLPKGIYILVVIAFDDEGNVYREKLTVGLG